MPDNKTIVNQDTLPVTQPDSAAGGEVDTDSIVSAAAEMGHTLPISDDIAPADLDWSEMAPLQEFDDAAQGLAPQQEAVQQASVADDGSLTDSMSKRISGIKERSAKDLAEKDAQIASRDDEISKLKDMAQNFKNLQQQWNPVPDNTDAIQTELTELDAKLKEEGDLMTSAEVGQQMVKRMQLEKDLETQSANAATKKQLIEQHQVMRQRSDQYVKDTYDFVSNPESEYYKVLKGQAYPLLEQLMGTNFKEHPHDMVMAAELTKMMVNSQKYEQMLGNTPAPRAAPAPMAGSTPRTAPANQPAQAQNFRQQVTQARGGDLSNFAKILQGAGHSWNPNG